MNLKKLTPELKKQLEYLVDEELKSEKINEKNKLIFSEELKKLSPKEIKNTPVTEERISLWSRIKKVLGMN
jgi:hypothetical protein